MPATQTTVIVTTRNRAPLLRQALHALLAARPLPDQILVVNNASTDDTDQVIRGAQARSPGRIVALHEPRVGYAQARNRGLQHARGELVAFVDDDCTCAPDWVAALVAAHRQHPDCVAVGGLTLGRDGTCAERAGHLFGLFATLEAAVAPTDRLHRLLWPERALRHPQQVTALSTQNIAFKRAALQGRWFDPEAWINEDLDFCWQLYRDHPQGLLYWPTMVCHHRYRRGRAEFLRQHLSYGRSYAASKAHMQRKGNLPPQFRGVTYHRRLARYLAFTARQCCAPRLTAAARAELAALLLGREAAFLGGYLDGALRGTPPLVR